MSTGVATVPITLMPHSKRAAFDFEQVPISPQQREAACHVLWGHAAAAGTGAMVARPWLRRRSARSPGSPARALR